MGELKRLFRDSGAVRVSRSMKELALKTARLNRESLQSTGKELTVSQLAKRLDVSPEQVTRAVAGAQAPLSLTAFYDEDGSPQLDVPVPDIQDEAAERLSLHAALADLPGQDRRLIELRYYCSLTQVQTAQRLGMTQVQVSRREKKLLALLREKLA